MSQAKEFEDEQTIWTPEGNPSLKNKEKAEVLFPQEEKYHYINVIFEAKGDTVLTFGALQEMKTFEEQVLEQVSEYSDTFYNDLNKLERPKKGTLYRFQDVCWQ